MCRPSMCMVWGLEGDALQCLGSVAEQQPLSHRSQVRETVSLGSTLVTLRCTDPAGDEGSLRYTLEGPAGSHSYFHMEGPQLKVCVARAGEPPAGEQGPCGIQQHSRLWLWGMPSTIGHHGLAGQHHPGL